MNDKTRLRTVVCGSRFGQFYLEALKIMPDEFEIEGLLAKGSERSQKCAERYGINLYRKVEDLPDTIDLVCVALRSGVMGGDGTEVSLRLLERGIHVFLEQPVHHRDMASCLKTARQKKVCFRTGDLYPHLPAVRRFISCARAVTQRQKPLFIDAACATQVAYPMMHILLEALPAVRPFKVETVIKNDGPFQVLTGEIGGVPLMMRAHNEVDPQDPDNHLHLLHQLTIGVAGGSLALTDTHGPVIWRPRMHIPDRRDIPGGLAVETPPHLRESSSRILGPAISAGYGDILLKQWPRAIARDLSAMREAVLGKTSMDAQAQRELLCSRHWQEITGALGYPVLRPRRGHEPLPVEILEEAAAETAHAEDYTPAEESAPAKAETDVYACTEAAEHLARNLEVAQVKKCVALLEDAAFCSMIRALQSGGALATPGRRYTLSGILSDLKVAPRHQGIISRWLRILTQRGYIRQLGESYSGVAPVTEEMMHKRWDSAMAAWNGVLGSRETIDYLASNAEHLPRLMRDEQQAALLLFPEGRMDIADALYRKALTARYLNRSAAEAVMRIMAGKRISGDIPSDNSLKILEIGAGTGATTEVIVDALKNAAREQLPVHYLFTDVSNFFLAEARKRFKDCPWMDFAILDINRSLSPQGTEPESVDIIIAAGMLNNARDTDKTIRDLMARLVPGGWMVITEPVREFPEMLISQAFMMTPPEDGRKSTETTFMSVEQWLDVFKRAGGNEVRALPEEDHPLSPLGQKLFIARRI